MALSYMYDAAGRKLTKNANGNIRNYVDGIEYSGTAIDIIHTEEGVAQNNGGFFTYQYNLGDHLGNVRYTFDIYNGAVRRLQQDDYYAFGLRRSVSPVGLDNKYLYNGKEIQDELGGQYDYGARFCDPVIGRFNTVDPLSEKSRRFSPHSYGLNNPIRFIDVDGMYAAPPDLEVEKQKNGTYKVTGGTANSDRNIYVMENGKRTDVIGKMLTEYSFHDDSGNAVQGAILNPGDKSGINFMNNEIIGGSPSLINYMPNAIGGEKYDFKTRGIDGIPRSEQDAFKYRGMPFEGVSGFGNQDGKTTTYASARDFGNVGAGYVAGKNGLGWRAARLGFDGLESKQRGGLFVEGQPSQRAEKVGFVVGSKVFDDKQTAKRLNQAISPWSIGPKY